MRFSILTASLTLFCLSNLLSQNLSREDYINKYYTLAVEEMNLFKIPASIKLAQGLLETENGNSRLCKEANNHFGIKCKANWTGPTFIKDDDKKNECFRAYLSAEESYRDHSLFLQKDRYSELFTYEMSDYRSWAYGLKKAGYATNPKYPQILIQFIEDLKLYRYDKFGLAKMNNPTPATNSKKEVVDNETLIKRRRELANNLNLVIVDEDFDIYKLSKETGIMVSKLMDYNDVQNEQALRLGQNFFLEKKLSAHKNETHTALVGESLYDISQMYGLSLKQLRKYNRLEDWEQPAVGEPLNLSRQGDNYIKTRPFYEIARERSKGNLKLFIPVDVLKNENIEPSKTTRVIEKPEMEEVIEPVQTTVNKESSPSQKSKSWIDYTVKPKETLFRISKNYDCKPHDVLNWNNITVEDGLQIGQVLKLYTAYPEGKIIQTTPVSSTSSSKGYIIHPAEPPKTEEVDTPKVRYVNGIRVQRISLKEFYSSMKIDSTSK